MLVLFVPGRNPGTDGGLLAAFDFGRQRYDVAIVDLGINRTTQAVQGDLIAADGAVGFIEDGANRGSRADVVELLSSVTEFQKFDLHGSLSVRVKRGETKERRRDDAPFHWVLIRR